VTTDSVRRGPLEVTIKSASPQVEVGLPFTLNVDVENPYELPVTIERINAELGDVFRLTQPVDSEELSLNPGNSTVFPFHLGTSLSPWDVLMFFPGAYTVVIEIAYAVGGSTERNRFFTT
jgi:hypothetical protein